MSTREDEMKRISQEISEIDNRLGELSEERNTLQDRRKVLDKSWRRLAEGDQIDMFEGDNG